MAGGAWTFAGQHGQPAVRALEDGPRAERLERGPSARVMETLGSITVGEAAQLFIGKRYRGVLRRGREITSASSDESLHALRIRCKRLRYLLEFFRPTYGELLKAETTRLKELQDVLGEFQDACVAAGLLRRYAEGLPMGSGNQGQLMALDQMIAGQDRRVARAGPTSLMRGNSSIPRVVERDSSLTWRRVTPRSPRNAPRRCLGHR